MQVDNDNYLTLHVHSPPECLPIILDRGKIIQALARGTIPLLKIEAPDADDGAETANVEIVAFAPDMAFVAISHVWAQGLGNVWCDAA